MKFNIEDYEGKYVMHCKTEEEARDFCNYLTLIGRPLRCSLWCYYGTNVIFFNNGTWGDLDYAKKDNYTILEWSDFMREFTKADLKTGDVVMQRDGTIQIANCELGMFITGNHWNDIDEFKGDLTNTVSSEYDIIAVRRPTHKSHCTFKAFKHESGTLVYERKEVEEMTLAEVCRLLGKEIKIVK